MSTPVTLCGRLTRDPELMFSGQGAPIVKFSVATSRRVRDKDTGEWSDADTSFWDCTAFGELAENLCESLQKGTAVLVQGNCKQETWQDKTTGEKRSAFRVVANDVGVNLRWHKTPMAERTPPREKVMEAPF